MNSIDIKEFLKNNAKIFSLLPEERLDAIIKGSVIRTYEQNEGILEFGEEGTFLGVLYKGDAVASVTDDHADRKDLFPIRPGGLIGLIPMMTGDTHLTDVIGVSRCTVIIISQDLFNEHILTHLPTIQEISKIMSRMIQKFTVDDEGREMAAKAFGQNKDSYGFMLQSKEPMKICVINCGLTVLKYNIFNTADESRNAVGRINYIGSDDAEHIYKNQDGETVKQLGKIDHDGAFSAMFSELTDKKTGVINSSYDVVLVGHRIVHGGSEIETSVVITKEIEDKIEKLSKFAPLHNPYNLLGIHKGKEFFADAMHVAVVDTEFHHTMPPYAYLYGLPYKYYEEDGIRRYGFHGMSHSYVALKAAEFLKKPFNKLEIVTCHMGNTASLCAIDHGRSVDTTMGLSPTEGLLMGNRCGDIDASAVLQIMKDENKTVDEMQTLLNRESGLRGLSGISGGIHEIINAAEQGNHRAMLAYKTFCYRVRKYIGAYVAAMEGIDALVFTGGVGEGGYGVRTQACQGLECMGIIIDEERNRNVSTTKGPVLISSDDSAVSVLVIPTDQERMIARNALKTKQYNSVSTVLKKQNVPIPIEVSAHHIHLTQEHVEMLYGKGHTLTPKADLSQPGQFACEEQVTLSGPKGKVSRVRVLGPVRKETQVEISMTEQFQLGIQAPLRASGILENTPGVTLEGTAGNVDIDHGVICALRHIHMTPEDGELFGLHDRDVVRVQISGDRELIYGDVLVRIHPEYKLAMHIDTDEANAANLKTGVVGNIIQIQNRI